MKATKTVKNKLLLLSAAALLVMVLLPKFGPLAKADNVVEGYTSADSLQPGQIVALVDAKNKTVKAAPANDATGLYGVVVDPSDAPITLVGQNSKVFVATTG